MHSYWFTIINSFIDGAIFLIATLFIIFPKRKKPTRDHILMIIFWSAVSFIFFLNGIQMYLFVQKNISTSYLIIQCEVAIMIFLCWIASYFFVSKLLESNRLKKITFFLIAILLLIVLCSFLFVGRPAMKFGEPRIELPNQVIISYLVALLLAIFNFLIFVILWKEFRRGVISWEKLAPFYRIVAIGIFGAVTFLRTLYLLPHPWYIRVFYLLIPYLNYLASKEEKKNEERSNII